MADTDIISILTYLDTSARMYMRFSCVDFLLDKFKPCLVDLKRDN